MKSPIPTNEAARMQVLKAYDVLDTPAEAAFDDLTLLASQICDTPVALFTLIDGDRQWFKSAVGVEVTETPRDVSFCAHAITQSDLFIIPDAAKDIRFADNPFVTSDPNIRFYAGAPLITADGYALGTLCALDQKPRDLSPQQQDALRALSRLAMAQLELRRTLKQLRELQTLRDNLTQMIVHDLRTPLTSLLGGLQVMEMSNELNEELLAISIHGGKTLLGMINDLLDIEKLEDGSLKLEYSSLDAGGLVSQAFEQVAVLADGREIVLMSDIAPALPIVNADAGKLLRTLVNLLGNAIKFTPAGGSVILSVRREEGDTGLLFAVRDTGEGIPADAMERIFEKFGQVESRQSGRTMSTGLGLSFCKMVVEAHRGCIWVESVMGSGSTFFFRIPVE